MAHLTKTKQCPSCGHDNSTRLKRTLWHRLFANSGLYRCNRCNEEYLVLGCCPKTERTKHA